MTSRHVDWQSGALVGLTLLFVGGALADEALRDRVHREHKDRSYMLIEDADGARLYLFGTGSEALRISCDEELFAAALEKTRSSDPRTRVTGLVELAGAGDAAALDAALTLLTDPEPSVRDEARQLILDHPDGQAVVDALGLVDEDFSE